MCCSDLCSCKKPSLSWENEDPCFLRFLIIGLYTLFLLALQGETGIPSSEASQGPAAQIIVCFFLLSSFNLLPSAQAKEGTDPDNRKPFNKRASKSSDATDFAPGADAQLLDPISEEDEKLDHSLSSRTSGFRKKGVGSFYCRLSNEEDSGPDEADNTTPLLHKEARASSPSSHRASQPAGLLTKPGLLTEVLLDKKDSLDSGSNDSSPDLAMEEAEGASDRPKETLKPSLIELELEGLVKKRGALPSRLSGLQDAAVARMSICSDVPSEASLMASSPDEEWLSNEVSNLNRTASDTTLNNNTSSPINTNTNNSHQQDNIAATTPFTSIIISPAVIITPGSSAANSTAATAHHNQNLRTFSLGDERESVL